MRDVRRSFKARTGGDALLVVDLLKSPPSGIPLLTSNSPEIEFPMIIPPGLIPCGPILRPASSVEVADPALAGWLASGPTVYINLGSHFITQEDQAIELAKALRLVFDITEKNSTLSGLRVLWKIKRPSEAPYGFEDKSPIHEIIGKEMDDDRVRIESWINVEPQAILNSGHVICSVNHGGASSWNEAVS